MGEIIGCATRHVGSAFRRDDFIVSNMSDTAKFVFNHIYIFINADKSKKRITEKQEKGLVSQRIPSFSQTKNNNKDYCL